jgi:hypothetical protein
VDVGAKAVCFIVPSFSLLYKRKGKKWSFVCKEWEKAGK